MEINLSIKSKLKYLLSIFVFALLFISIPRTFALKVPTVDSTFDNYFDFPFIAQWTSNTRYEGTVDEIVELEVIESFTDPTLVGKKFWFYTKFDFAFDFWSNSSKKYIWTGYDGPYGLWEIYQEPDKVPVFNGETAFITSIDNLISIQDILARISAWDNEDGNITHLIQIDNTSSYNENITELGSYQLKLYVIDSAGNRTDITVYVVVKDVVAPTISGPNNYTQSYKSKKDVSTIINALSVTDNYDKTGLTIKVKSDDYSANYNKVGSYNIVLYATDSSGNEGIYTVTVNVIDDVDPVFSGPTTIIKQQKQKLLLSDILAQVTVNDEIDKNINFVVKKDSYTGHGHLVGTYTIVLEATDSSGNTSTHTITITVKDDIPPIFYVDNFFIHVDDVVKLSRQDIIDLLIASGQLQLNGSTTFTFTLNEYEGNENIPGLYGVIVNATSTSGESKQISLAIQVNETEDKEDDIIIEEPKGFFGTIFDFLKKTWNWLFTTTKEDGNFYNVYYILIVLAVLVGISILTKKPRRRYHR